MKHNRVYKITVGILALIILSSLINSIFVKIFNEYTIVLFLIICILLVYKLLGIYKNKSIIEKDVILSVIAYCISFYLIIYILGFFIGFYKNLYSLKIIDIIRNIFPVILTIITMEILRHLINVKIKDNNLLIVLSVVGFTLLSNTIIIRGILNPGIASNEIIKQIGLFILPTITTNILLTYLSIISGYKTTIVYRLLIELPLYILAIFPDFGNYIESVIRISFPIIVMLGLYRNIEKNKVRKKVILNKNKYSNKIKIGLLTFVFIIIYFISGYFRYYAVVIATGSMAPNIKIGDIAIVKKLNKEDISTLKVGDILAYKKGNITVCHRIAKKITMDKSVYFETKGDHNNSSDQFLVEENQIIGTVNLRIKYIGYPTVVLNELVNR